MHTMFNPPPPPKKFWFDPILDACQAIISSLLVRWFLLVLTLCRTLGFPLVVEEHIARRHLAAPRRKRALTIPLDTGLLPWKRRETLAQDGCVLFQLPAEIRMLVYEAYIREGGEEIAVGRGIGGRRGGKGKMDVLPLLVTCRRIYSEAIPFLYSAPTFSFRSPDALISFNSSILPERRAALRHVQLDASKLNARYMRLYRNAPNRPVYPRQSSQHLTPSRLPQMQWRDATFWSTACIVLEDLGGLKSVSLVVLLETAAEGSLTGWKPPWDLLEGLEKLRERGVGIEAHVKGVVWSGCRCSLCCGDAAWKGRDGTMTVRKKVAEGGRWCVER